MDPIAAIEQRSQGQAMLEAESAAVGSNGHPVAHSPLSPSDPNQPRSKRRKKVDFSPLDEYLRPSQFSDGSVGGSDVEPLKPIPPSRALTALKSILKPTDRVIPTISASEASMMASELHINENGNFIIMVDSLLLQLAADARSSRLDAYLTLIRVLRRHRRIPDAALLVPKLGRLLQFIERDICAKMPTTSLSDSTLIGQALRLLIILTNSALFSPHLPDPFCTTMLQFVMAALESPTRPKAVVKLCTLWLTFQHLPATILTPERAGQIILALEHLEDRVQGASIARQKLTIYQRLLSQAPQMMSLKAKHWLHHLFSGLLSDEANARARAITLGLETGALFGTSTWVARAVKELFHRDNNTFASDMEEQLLYTLADRDAAVQVPQIWSVVVLFLRARPRQLEQWDFLTPWLLLIQKCFNSTDPAVKREANFAWYRMIFAIRPDQATGWKMIRILRQPIVGQLAKSRVHKPESVAHRMHAFAGLCCLLYYSLPPSAAFEQLDRYWDECVVAVVISAVICGDNDACHDVEAAYGLQVLSVLFNRSPRKMWEETRALRGPPIATDELPPLDAKWIRSRTPTILKACASIFAVDAAWATRSSVWRPLDVVFGPDHAEGVWYHYMSAVAEAGSMEVTVSAELMTVVAHLANFFERLWTAPASALGAVSEQSAEISLCRFANLVATAVDCLGPLVFTEKLLAPNADCGLEVIGSPSRRSSRKRTTEGLSFLTHLCQLLTRPGHDRLPPGAYRGLATTVLRRCCRARNSVAGQLDVLNDCLHALPALETADDRARGGGARDLWNVITEISLPILCDLGRHSAPTDPESVRSDDDQPAKQSANRLLRSIVRYGASFDERTTSRVRDDFLADTATAVRSSSDGAGLMEALIQPLIRVRHATTDQSTSDDQLCQASGEHHVPVARGEENDCQMQDTTCSGKAAYDSGELFTQFCGMVDCFLAAADGPAGSEWPATSSQAMDLSDDPGYPIAQDRPVVDSPLDAQGHESDPDAELPPADSSAIDTAGLSSSPAMALERSASVGKRKLMEADSDIAAKKSRRASRKSSGDRDHHQAREGIVPAHATSSTASESLPPTTTPPTHPRRPRARLDMRPASRQPDASSSPSTLARRPRASPGPATARPVDEHSGAGSSPRVRARRASATPSIASRVKRRRSGRHGPAAVERVSTPSALRRPVEIVVIPDDDDSSTEAVSAASASAPPPEVLEARHAETEPVTLARAASAEPTAAAVHDHADPCPTRSVSPVEPADQAGPGPGPGPTRLPDLSISNIFPPYEQAMPERATGSAERFIASLSSSSPSPTPRPRPDASEPCSAKEVAPEGSPPAKQVPVPSQSPSPSSSPRPGRGGGIIGGLKRILGDLRRAVLGPHEVREIDDLLFEVKREAFAAERRVKDKDDA